MQGLAMYSASPCYRHCTGMFIGSGKEAFVSVLEKLEKLI
jgi:hypothetical protein